MWVRPGLFSSDPAEQKESPVIDEMLELFERDKKRGQGHEKQGRFRRLFARLADVEGREEYAKSSGSRRARDHDDDDEDEKKRQRYDRSWYNFEPW